MESTTQERKSGESTEPKQEKKEQNQITEEEKEEIIGFINSIKKCELREKALSELSRNREKFKELAPYLWYSVGTIAALLQEIVSIYPLLAPPNLTASTTNNVCNVLTLLQCLASHPETRSLFLNAHIPLFLYPFLNTVNRGRSFEYLRLTSLGVIGSLVKADDPAVISFLLQTEIIPLCLRIMEMGTELSKIVATFILQKILLDDDGLNYICQTAERFYAVSTVLSNLVNSQSKNPSERLLKHIIRCYFRLSENVRANTALRENLPQALKDVNLVKNLDESTKRCFHNLILNLHLSPVMMVPQYQAQNQTQNQAQNN